MSRPYLLPFVLAGAFASTLLAASPDAHACGGCFPPPGDQQSVVTDHRMILSIAKDKTTLYDQIRYAGSPEQFAWVLPISGTVDVGLSADTLFGALENLTATVVQAPPTNCPGYPSDCIQNEGDFAAPSAAGASSSGGGVDVIKQETVGPYDTVQLHSTDPNALTTWLTTNGYAIPDDIKPVINAYVAEHFDFLALRLTPGQGVQAMRPVRISTTGASSVLPLRMVAAGTGATVGITLWVVGEGRYEPQNFQSFIIKSDELVWDWTAGVSNYKEIRATKASALGGTGWEIESSKEIGRYQIENIVTNLANVNPSVGSDYTPIEQSGVVVKTADQARTEDIDALFAGLQSGTERVTRMRADLAKAALATDLTMIASADQTTIDNIRVPTQEKNQPQCPVYNGCSQVGTAPRDQAAAQTEANNGHGSFSCDVAKKRDASPVTAAFGGLGALVALALVRARKNRKGLRRCETLSSSRPSGRWPSRPSPPSATRAPAAVASAHRRRRTRRPPSSPTTG
jgi:hypothetical protein